MIINFLNRIVQPWIKPFEVVFPKNEVLIDTCSMVRILGNIGLVEFNYINFNIKYISTSYC
jgi:hypothetical protein